jgi:adenylylsulfate kinase
MKETCHEKHGRSIAKAVSYRVVSIVIDLTLVFALTKKVELTLGIVLLSNTASIFVYYFHERAWNVVHLGRRPSQKK